jgi:hypothetical protein
MTPVESKETKMDSPAKAANVTPLLVLISAPSGAGKTTLCQQLLSARPDMARAITCTTRDPRAGEKDGVDYYFLDAGSFLKRVQAGNFLEHATVFGNSYGTLKAEVLGKLRQGKDVLLNVDVQGAATIRSRAEEDCAFEKTRDGFRRGDSKTPQRRPPGNRPVEKFRLPADQRQHQGRFAEDAVHC